MTEQYHEKIVNKETIKERAFFTQYNVINYIEVKAESRTFKEQIREEENLVSLLWDELEGFLEYDEDFEIEKIEKKSITINP